jgi:hypothetical protein
MTLESQLLNKNLRKLIDEQDNEALVAFLEQQQFNPNLDLNHVSRDGVNALWYAFYPPEGAPSVKIINTLIDTGKINTHVRYNNLWLGNIAPHSVLSEIHYQNLEESIPVRRNQIPVRRNLLQIAEDSQNTHDSIIVRKTDEALVKLYQRYVNKDNPLDNSPMFQEMALFIQSCQDKNTLTKLQAESALEALLRIKVNEMTRELVVEQGKVILGLGDTLDLLWRALNDTQKESWVEGIELSEEEQDSRKLRLIDRLIQSQHEYGANIVSCDMGTRNLIVDSLNKTHKQTSLNI